MVLNEEFHILTIHFEPPKRGQPLYKGQSACMVPRYPLYGGSTLLSIQVSFNCNYYIIILCIGNSSTVVIIYCVVFVIVLILSIITTG